jgi:hypothetical protein
MTLNMVPELKDLSCDSGKIYHVVPEPCVGDFHVVLEIWYMSPKMCIKA